MFVWGHSTCHGPPQPSAGLTLCRWHSTQWWWLDLLIVRFLAPLLGLCCHHWHSCPAVDCLSQLHPPRPSAGLVLLVLAPLPHAVVVVGLLALCWAGQVVIGIPDPPLGWVLSLCVPTPTLGCHHIVGIPGS
jgi:hypothetical protein